MNDKQEPKLTQTKVQQNVPPFTSLRDHLIEGRTIGQLVTAIESGGCYGWDRYGRFRHSKIDESITDSALDCLAERHSHDNQAFPDPLEIYEAYNSRLQLFGWPDPQPPFEDVPEHPHPKTEKELIEGMHTNTAYRIIRDLLVESGGFIPKKGKLKHGLLSALAKTSQEIDGVDEDGNSSGLHRDTFSKHLQIAIKSLKMKN